MADAVELIKHLYRLFNERDMEAALACMREDVAWANGMEGGHVYGRDGVRDYWTRQWAMIDPNVQPLEVAEGPNGEVIVQVRAVVHDLNGNLLSDGLVGHVFRFENGLVKRFEIRDPSGTTSSG